MESVIKYLRRFKTSTSFRVIVGSSLGSYISVLLGAEIFTSIIFGAIGGFVGIWLGFKMS
jgi:hypothetical protein